MHYSQSPYSGVLSAHVALAADANAFFSTFVGEYIMEKSRAEASEIVEKILISDDCDEIMRLQAEYQATVKAINWIKEAIEAGEIAEANLELENNK